MSEIIYGKDGWNKIPLTKPAKLIEISALNKQIGTSYISVNMVGKDLVRVDGQKWKFESLIYNGPSMTFFIYPNARGKLVVSDEKKAVLNDCFITRIVSNPGEVRKRSAVVDTSPSAPEVEEVVKTANEIANEKFIAKSEEFKDLFKSAARLQANPLFTGYNNRFNEIDKIIKEKGRILKTTEVKIALREALMRQNGNYEPFQIYGINKLIEAELDDWIASRENMGRTSTDKFGPYVFMFSHKPVQFMEKLLKLVDKYFFAGLVKAMVGEINQKIKFEIYPYGKDGITQGALMWCASSPRVYEATIGVNTFAMKKVIMSMQRRGGVAIGGSGTELKADNLDECSTFFNCMVQTFEHELCHALCSWLTLSGEGVPLGMSTYGEGSWWKGKSDANSGHGKNFMALLFNTFGQKSYMFHSTNIKDMAGKNIAWGADVTMLGHYPDYGNDRLDTSMFWVAHGNGEVDIPDKYEYPKPIIMY